MSHTGDTGRSGASGASAQKKTLRPLRILLHYDCLYPETIGGVEHRNRELGGALAARGHQVTVSGFTNEPAAAAGGLRRISLGAKRGGRRGILATLRFAAATARLDVSGFDVVETANIPYAHVLPLAQRCRVADTPLLVTWHEVWGETWRRHVGPLWPLAAALETACARAGSVAVAVSSLTARRVARRRRGRVGLVSGGVAIAALRRIAGDAGPPGPPLLVAGRLLPEKRLDLLVRAVAILPRAEHPLLTIVGEGPDRPRLEALAAELGVAAAIRFAGRLPDEHGVWRELGRASVAVQPSAREGFGLFALEAMAAGLPVVACESPESAVGELVRDGVEGRVVAPTPEALAAAIQLLLLHEPTRRRLGLAAAARAREYDWERVAERAEAELYCALEAGAGAARSSTA